MNRIEPACHETILLVDDEPQVRSMLYQILTTHGYEVIQAVDGQDALEKFEQNPKGISLVVTDILMPRMDGVSSVKAMSSINPSVKVLFMTGYMSDQPDPKARILIKPFPPTKILQTIRAILEGPQAPSPDKLT